MADRTLVLLFGGRSSEHEISLLSAASVLEALRDSDMRVFPIGITREGDFYLYNGSIGRIRDGSWSRDEGNLVPVYPIRGGFLRTDLQTLLPSATVFPCLHGEYCEDGRIQGMLELFGIPYIGSDAAASTVCFDKILTKERLRRFGIPVTPWVSGEVRSDAEALKLLHRAEAQLFYPVFVKPSRSGSSIGASPAKNGKDLLRAIKVAAEVDPRVLVEPLVVCREIELSLLDGETPTVAPAAEPIHGASYYDYNAKYRGKGARLAIPAALKPHTARTLSDLALRIFRALGCRHLARVDFFVCEDGKILFNEINTLPGMTEMSVYPRALAAAGVPLPALMQRLVALASDEDR